MDYNLLTPASKESASTPIYRGAGRRVELVATGQGQSGDAYTLGLETGGARSTGIASDDRPIAASRPAAKAVAARVIHSCRALFAECVDNLGRAIDCNADFFLRNSAVEHVKDSLGLLWSKRAEREGQFAEIVNALQTTFLNRKVEDFSEVQLQCLLSIFEKLMHENQFDDEFTVSIVTDLLNGDVDVFREID